MEMDETRHRVFVSWDGGEVWLTSLSPDFHAVLQEMVEAYGPPEKVEFRATDEGWIGSDAE